MGGGGASGTEYDLTRSGWFDSRTFETWFVEVFPQNIPASKNDPIFVIGDNLSSHFSTYLIQECIKNNIIFVTMPPNSTHLCQPLDVAAFGSLKRSWRKILDHWRKESRSKRFIPKSQFSASLERLADTLSSSSLRSGFRACGLFLSDRNEVLKKMPSINRDPRGEGTSSAMSALILHHLQVRCSLNQRQAQTNYKRGSIVESGCLILPESLASIGNASSQNHATNSTTVGNFDSEDEEQWICSSCNKVWKKMGDDRWIVRDHCNKQYHF